MNSHDIDTGLPHVAFCRARDVDPNESHHRQLGVSADTRLYTEDQVRAAIEADRKRTTAGFRTVGEIRLDANRHPYACLLTGYDEHGNQWKEGTPIYAALQPTEHNIDYKKLYEQMCNRCDSLDAKLAEYERRGEPVAWWIANPHNGEPVVSWRKVDADTWAKNGYSVNPLYAAPQPTEPVKIDVDALAQGES